MKNRITLWLFCLVFTSCATNFDDVKKFLLQEPEKKSIEDNFELDQNMAREFATNENENINPISSKDNTNNETTLMNDLKVVKEKPSKTSQVSKKKGKKIDLAMTKTAPALSEVQESANDKNIPEDYPAHFKKYDENSKKLWPQFKAIYLNGERSIFSISYLGVTAGYITISSKGIKKVAGKEAFHYFARFKSEEAYRYFYWLDDYLETFVEKENFLPIKYSLIQREKKQNVDDLQLFDRSKLKNFTWYKRTKEGSNRNEKKEVYIPYYLQDSFSALQFVRGLPLKPGDRFEFPVATRADTWILKAEVSKIENIKIMGRDISAIKVNAETHFPGVLQKSGDIYFWYANDEDRRLLKFQAKIKLGSIYGDLVEYQRGDKVSP